MTTSKFWNQLIIFVITLLLILSVREYFLYQLIETGIEPYHIHTWIKIGANLLLIVLSYFLIKRNGLTKTAGLEKVKLQKAYLLIFPLVYFVLLNTTFMEDIDANFLIPNIATLIIYCISIGFAEELSIRGFLQSHLINRFGNTQKSIIISVFAASLFFGIIHLMNFDKGIYGELSQVFFATSIGVAFGFLLVITKRIYPLIIVHALIDFVADLDSAGVPITEKIIDPTSLENSIFIVILTLPGLLYGIFLMRKSPLIDITEKH